MLKEFKEFAARGNMIDLAVGLVLGGAFGKIVTSLVEDVLMPPLGLVLGKVDFGSLFVNLSGETYATLAAAKAASAPVIGYGAFLNTLVNFLVVSFAMFMVVKGVNRLRREEPAAPEPPAEPTAEEQLLTEIRDLLKSRSA